MNPSNRIRRGQGVKKMKSKKQRPAQKKTAPNKKVSKNKIPVVKKKLSFQKSRIQRSSTRRKKESASRLLSRTKRASKAIDIPIKKTRIVRIMGQGQFTVNNSILKKLNEIDDSIVQLVGNVRSDDMEFKKRLSELTYIVEKNGKPLDPKEIIQSDIILPSVDLSIDEAKKLFKGEGVIPEI
jgi:PspAA-like protein